MRVRGSFRVQFAGTVLFLAGLTQTGSAQDPEDLVVQLGSDNARDRLAAYRKLRRSRPIVALPHLVKALPTYSIDSQDLGLSLLQVYPTQHAMPRMVTLSDSSARYLRLGASCWLYSRGLGGRMPQLEQKIRAALRASESAHESSLMLRRVSVIKTPGVASEVLGCVKRGQGFPLMDAGLRYLLGCRHREAIPFARDVLNTADRDAKEREICLVFLAAMGGAGASKNDVDVRLAEVIRGSKNLRRLDPYLQAAPTLGRLVLDALLDFATENEKKKGREVLVALRLITRHKYLAALPEITELLEHDDDQVSNAALDALTKLSGELDAKALRGMLSSSKTRLVVVAADGLRCLDDDSGLPKLLELANSQQVESRREVIAALGKFRDRRAVSALITALGDADRQVRSVAQRGLQKILRKLAPYRRVDLGKAGYRVDGDAAARAAAIAQIRHWWKLIDAR